MAESPPPPLEIRAAEFPADAAVVRTLLREYAHGLGVDLGFQHFDAELAGLPGRYAPPDGEVLLARRGAEVVGCVALRRTAGGDGGAGCAGGAARTGEMKRLFVRPSARGDGVGRRLAESILVRAGELGYARVVLDTLPQMTSAIALYESLGFRPIPPYVHNPVPSARFLGIDLASDRESGPASVRPT